MMILGLCGSPRVHGNTETLIEEALKGVQSEGAQTELYRLAGKNIQPCQGCWSCRKNGECRLTDDMQEVYGKLLAADGIIFGSPVYFYGLAAQSKAVIDRTIAFSQPGKNLRNKVGGVITTAGSMGMTDVLKEYFFYMATQQIIPAGFVAAYPQSGGGFAGMEKTLKAAFNLGREMVLVARHGPIYPPDFEHVHFAFGTHTR